LPGSSKHVDALVRTAYRRSLLVLGIKEAVFPVALVFGGAALLLVVGTQILDWYWLVILLATGFLAAFIRMRHRTPTAYGVAQTLDRRLALNDTISTAWFIGEHPELAGTFAGQIQLAQAEALAAGIDSANALPIRGVRSWTIPAALAAVAFGLFCVRYLVRHDLDLKQSLVPIHFNAITAAVSNAWSAAEKKLAHIVPSPAYAADTRPASTEREASRTSDVLGLKKSSSPGSEAAAESRNSTPPLFPNGVQDATGSKGPGRDGTPNSSASANHQPSSPAAQEKDDSGRSKPSSGQQSQGLLNRMKDAMSSLMAEMKPASSSKSSSQSTARSAAAPDQDLAQTEGDQSQSQTSASQNSQNTPNAKSKGDEHGQAVEMPQPAASESSRNSPRQGGSSQSKSGVGKQDGSKSVKEAEELRAMGKLAEIIGKRSQDITGEAMVETPSGKQQLKTGYTGEVGQHSDKGGEIDRDEVPLEFQQYVREYMERVHRQGPKAE
jgi:hypothetical protein